MTTSTKTLGPVLAAWATILTVALLVVAGCGGPVAEPATAHDNDEHDHGDEGPHGGHIIELGTEDHHAELTHDEDSHRVGIYVLGDDAKTAVPIGAESVTINVSVDGQPSQYVLPAAPQAGESAGKSSYFELESESLHVVVSGESETPNTQARLSLTINGKPYRGTLEHGHGPDNEHEHE